MNEIVYLEPDEDITGVIAKVKETASDAICLVIPRGGAIAQSIVNLKLLKREIEKHGKTVSLITKDKISKNLASQVGVTVYSGISEAKNSRSDNVKADKINQNERIDGFSTTGIKINQYTREYADEPAEESVAEELEAVDEQEFAEQEPVVDSPVAVHEVDHGYQESEDARVASERNALAHAKPEIKVKEPAVVEEKKEVTKHNVSSRRKPTIIIISTLLLILFISATLLYPSAEAKITLATNDIEDISEIVADKSLAAVNLETMAMPAREYVIDKTAEKQVATSGKKDIGEKASGEVTFYNSYDNKNPIVLPSGTILVAAGKTFLLDGAVTIPAAEVELIPIFKIIAGQAKGKVIAKDSGESSNIGASKFVISAFSGSKQEKIYGQSAVAMAGGTTKELKLVAKEDIEQAKSLLGEEQANIAKEDLIKKAEEDNLKLIASSILTTEVDSTSNKAVGDEAETVTVKLTTRLTELAYSEKELRDMAMEKINKSLQENEMLVGPTEADLVYDISKIESAEGKAFFKTTFSGKVGKKLDSANIQQMLAKSKYGNARSRVEAIDGVKEAQINIQPKFWPFMPFLTQRIKIVFDYQKE